MESFSRIARAAQEEAEAPQPEPSGEIADFSAALAQQEQLYTDVPVVRKPLALAASPEGEPPEAQAAAEARTVGDAIKIFRQIHAIASARLLSLLALAGMLGMFGFCVAEPNLLRIVASSLFAVLVFLPAVWVDAR